MPPPRAPAHPQEKTRDAPSRPPTDLERLWADLLEYAARRPRLRALLGKLTPRGLDGPVLVLEAPAETAAMARSYAGEIAEAAGRVTGRPMRVEIASPIAKGEPEEEKSEASQTTEKDLSEGPESHPLVRETMEVFGASIKRVDPIRPETDETTDGNGSA